MFFNLELRVFIPKHHIVSVCFIPKMTKFRFNHAEYVLDMLKEGLRNQRKFSTYDFNLQVVLSIFVLSQAL